MPSALNIIQSTTPHKPLRAVIQQLTIALQEGQAFHQALQKHPKHFDLLYCRLIEIAEASGTLGAQLKRLEHLLAQKKALHNTLRSACAYPLTVLVISMVMTLMIIRYVIPQFEGLFENLTVPLPRITQQLIDISHTLETQGLWAILWAVLILKYIHFWLAKLYHRGILFTLPGLKTHLQNALFAQSFRTLSATLNAQLPLLICLEMTQNSTPTRRYQTVFLDIQHEIQTGLSLHQAMAKQRLLPDLAIAFVQIGESSGQLPHMLEQLACFYENKTTQELQIASRLIEPLLMLLLSLWVGGLILALYMPIFETGLAL